MKVSQLIAVLATLPPDAELCMYIFNDEYGEAGLCPLQLAEYKEVQVFDHHTDHPTQKNTVEAHYRQENWVVLYPNNDEEHKYGYTGILYGRSKHELENM